MIFVGIDWAEATHAVCVLDEGGSILARATIPDSLAGVRQLHSILAEQGVQPERVIIGIETDRGLLVQALRTARYQLYALNPLAVSRYRERHTISGAKSDPADALLLAEIVRTDRHHHRLLAGDSAEVRGLQVLTRQHQRVIWTRKQEINQVRSALREFYPGALAAFGGELDTPVAIAVLQRAPTPARGRALSIKQLVSILRRAGAQRLLESRATTIQTALRQEQLALPTPLADAYGAAVQSGVQIIAALTTQIATLEEQIATQLNAHPDAEILGSLPGLGTTLGTRVLAEFGDDPTRYADSKARKCFAGTAPITRASGKKELVVRRRATNKWLLDACTWWGYTALRNSPGARRLYDAQRAAGKTHYQALRTVGNRLVGILHGCLRTRTLYDEATAWPVMTPFTTAKEPATDQNKSLKMAGQTHGSPSTIAASA